LSVLAGVYGRAASWRRAWYDRHPSRRRHLARPVISVGNLVVGGSGKTPAVAAIARLLQHSGERPAILSRGYARRESPDGVVVVSDGHRALEPVGRTGDEPQMLARALNGVPVLVARERYLAGCLAEQRFGASVHLLDDGYQHLALARDVDLLIVSPADLDEGVIPDGRLREPVSAARYADALLVPGTEDDARRVADATGCGRAFRLAVCFDPVRAMAPGVPHGARVVAVAGIARPQRFFAALRAQGWDVVREITFRDHHWFSARDVAAVAQAATKESAHAIVTTEKDAVRLDGLAQWAWLPMRMTIESEQEFIDWLAGRLARARVERGSAA
jgi:tetraacyldisaccharide 4'-kinase